MHLMDGGGILFLSSPTHERKEHNFLELTLQASLYGHIFTTVLRVKLLLWGHRREGSTEVNFTDLSSKI